jgi:hypothetical protein
VGPIRPPTRPSPPPPPTRFHLRRDVSASAGGGGCGGCTTVVASSPAKVSNAFSCGASAAPRPGGLPRPLSRLGAFPPLALVVVLTRCCGGHVEAVESKSGLIRVMA